MLWILPLLLIFGSGACFAQSINAGDIRGSVTDPSGALIPGVTVTVLNVDTGVSKGYTTNKDGLYDTNSIVPGHYTITFTHDGFEQFVRGPITLEVGFTTVNGQLKVGSTKEQVVVNTDVPLLATETGEQSTIMDAKSMDELPQVTQTWENFVILLPGATGSTSASPGQVAAINGNLPYNSFLSDGASTTLSQSMNTNPTTFEDVAELQITTSAFSAQYGTGGVIFNQITKSGTSTYHGTGYDFLQNGFFNAAPYTVGGGGKVSTLHYNNFGGALGGPLPKVKKAFFYFNYDHIINDGSNGGLNKYTVPTEAMMTGDFSEIAGTTTLYDPTTQTIATDSNGNPYPVRKSFQQEYGSNAIPTSALDSVAAKFIQWYPTPTNHIAGGEFLCGTSTTSACTSFGPHGEPFHNFGSNLSSPNPTTKYFGRLDYDITAKNRLTMSETMTDNPQVSNPSGVESCPVGCQSFDIQNSNAQITDVWTISSHVVNELRLGYTYQFNQGADETFGTGLPAQLGWKFAKENDFPDIDFKDGDWDPAWINKQGNNLYKEHVLDPSDVVTLVTGKHILHFGGEFQIYRNDSEVWNAAHQSGQFGFGNTTWCGCNNDYTAHWTTNSGGAASIAGGGWAMADFLLGYAASWSASSTPEYGSRFKSPQFFVQDDWKIRPNLTVNLGLRYQINHGWNEIHGDVDSFDPNVTNSDGTKGAMWFGSTHANGRTALEANVFNTVLPRVGFSWLLDPKTTLRGGFGVYSYIWSTDDYGQGLGGPFGGSGSANDITGGITPVTQLDGSGTNFVTGAALPFISNNTAVSAYNNQNVSYTDYHTPVPKILQWNVAVQREVARNLVVELAYVASHGMDMIFGDSGGVALNQIPQSELLSTGVNTAAIPYQNFAGGSITGYTNNAVTNYNSLQAQITRRYASGVSFNFNYVWSHMLDSGDSSGWGSHAGPLSYQNAYSPKANYASSNFDVRNAFKGNVVYQLPFGKGKPYLSQGTLLNEVAGGWQVSGTIVLTTGNPFSLTGDQLTNANGGGSYPNWSGASPKVAHKSITTWYNPGAFSRPANGTFGNVGRNVLYGPGIDVTTLSAHKEFALLEAWHHDVKLQLRIDAYNAFNHPSFGSPDGVLTGSAESSNSVTGEPYTGTSDGTYQINSVTVGGRSVQLGARLNF
jgi:hypothetical protein